MDSPPFQDQLRENYCWGCGANNPRGLRVKSAWDGDDAVCTWTPEPHHAAGPRHVLNGGIIATLIDCHCICTAVAAAYRVEGREIGTHPLIWYVTGSLQVTYLNPAPINGPVLLRAHIADMKEKKTTLRCSLRAGDLECARGEVVAVRVPPAWLVPPTDRKP
jgi:acyl-coenzyme A thioesterase PaaI-like protein